MKFGSSIAIRSLCALGIASFVCPAPFGARVEAAPQSATSANKHTVEVTVIEQPRVAQYVSDLFRTTLIRDLARTPGNVIHDLVTNVGKYPLFVFVPSEDPAARLNFTAYLRLLSIRHTDYQDPLFGDLYLLHELRHIETIPYEVPESFQAWHDKMTLNEKETTLFSEAWVHFMVPEVRARFPIKEIWVDRFLNETERLKPGMTNHELFAQSPEEFKSRLLARFVSIGKHPYSELDPIERRTWVYDRSNEVWSHVYWKAAQEIESHMREFYDLAESAPEFAARKHVEWLQSISVNGLVLPEPANEFYRFYKRVSELHLDPKLDNFCTTCEAGAAKLERLVKEGLVEPTPTLPQATKLLKYGVSGIVYSLPFPETRAITEKVWRNTDFGEIYGEAHTRKQDSEHRRFLEAFRKWAKPVVHGLDGFGFAYPSNGSSEALKDTLSLIRSNSPQAAIHVFEGEYEGVIAQSQALGLPLRKHPRNAETLANLASLVRPGDVFYLSQPSSLDGNVWAEYDRFMRLSKDAGLRILVDLAYVGAVAKNHDINLDYPHIEAVVFSLSKVFGTYYQRIGGVFSRVPNPLLVGNVWFKNLLSLRIGAELLETHGVYEMPRKYLWAQRAGVLEASKRLGMSIHASDVVLLANVEARGSDVAEDLKFLYRGGEQGHIRFCLTPMMSALINDQAVACQDVFAQDGSPSI